MHNRDLMMTFVPIGRDDDGGLLEAELSPPAIQRPASALTIGEAGPGPDAAAGVLLPPGRHGPLAAPPPAASTSGQRRRWQIKKASITTFSVVEGKVVYEIEVKGLEGRHWTVQRGIAEFQALERST